MLSRKAATLACLKARWLAPWRLPHKGVGVLNLVLVAMAVLQAPAAYARDNGQELTQTLMHIRAQDQRMQDIGWKLASANAPYCAQTLPAIGLQLVDAAGYHRPADIRQALGLSGNFGIYTIAAGSPASNTALPFLAEISAIDGQALADLPAKTHSDWQRLAGIHGAIDQSLKTDGTVELSLSDGRIETVEGTKICASRFELGGKNKRALADGSRVILGRNFPGFAYAEDELAAAIAHELAHNILGHKQWLDANGRKRKSVRLTEREADRLMPWLLANAGYDPRAAIRFMQRWGPAHGGGLLRKRTHDGWDERVEYIAAEIVQIEALQSPGQAADWSSHFRRDVSQD